LACLESRNRRAWDEREDVEKKGRKRDRAREE
jgi:hypothetical protein